MFLLYPLRTQESILRPVRLLGFVRVHPSISSTHTYAMPRHAMPSHAHAATYSRSTDLDAGIACLDKGPSIHPDQRVLSPIRDDADQE